MMLFQQVDENMSNLTSASGEASGSSGGNKAAMELPYFTSSSSSLQPPPSKKKRNLPGNPDPEAEVIALSPKTLVATNRFVCEICNKGFQRDQNLQLHRRGHNLPWKLKQRSTKDIPRKKVYVCPEAGCVHHDPARALGDLTGIKKHFSRKHGDKKWKCEKCSKRYAVQSDWKAHSKTCGTREYRCDCGTIFSRRDSFITHRAFCDALAEESARAIANSAPLPQMQLPLNLPPPGMTPMALLSHHHHLSLQQHSTPQLLDHNSNNNSNISFSLKKEPQQLNSTTTTNNLPSWLGPQQLPPPHLDHHQHNLSASSASSSPLLFSNIQDFAHHHIHLPPNPNPSSTATTTTTTTNTSPATNNHPHHLLPPLFPPPSAHMSATALLQKAAQMGATMSSAAHQDLNLLSSSASHDQTQPNKAVPQNSILHDVVMMGSLHSSDSSSSFDNNSMGGFGGVVNNPGSAHHHHQETSASTGNNSNGGDQGLTRDFLGLRPLSHSDILSLAGLGNTINISRDHQNNKPW